MVDLTSFMTRWLYLCNLVRDRAEIMSLPYNPSAPPHMYDPRNPLQPPQNVAHHPNIPPPPPHQSQQSTTASIAADVQNTQIRHQDIEKEWKDQCLRGLLSYPSGTQRLMAMDALRVELVQKLSQQLRMSDKVMQRFTASCRAHRSSDRLVHLENVDYAEQSDQDGDDSYDPFLDADVEIVRAFGEATMMEDEVIHMLEGSKTQQPKEKEGDDEAVLVISDHGTDLLQGKGRDELGELDTPDLLEDMPTSEELEEAQRLSLELRDYLPQLVSAVLHSPPALTRVQGLDPMQKLRRLILARCLQDANWGIELCWLLEAEVGRAWKTLFEHRQQTGKRLIVVLPAEKAAVLAKIGMEKRGAFNLLQDAEQATAYGYTLPSMEPPAPGMDHDEELSPPRLPSSLSVRRCSHFGDTMHFIDRLTQISLDLRRVPVVNRKAALEEALNEINRRLRRRMVTRGDVSLDVEDNRGPYDWPEIADLTLEMLNHSIHFPLVPKTAVWPSGDAEMDLSHARKTKVGAMKVLNIVSSDCRILASRERCPFMVHLEVCETDLDASDARLYAAGSRDLGTTVEEAIGLGVSSSSAAGASKRNYHENGGFPAYHIPPELLSSKPRQTRNEGSLDEANAIDAEYTYPNGGFNKSTDGDSGSSDVPRGGWQDYEGSHYPSESSDYLYSNPHDMMRQQEYEQLHQQMQFQQRPATQQQQPSGPPIPSVTTKSALLEKIFGIPWEEKCREIREASPYGQVEGWRLASFIMKAGEDIRREALVMQIIDKLNCWFKSDIPESHRPFLKPYTIMCVGGDAGLLECLSDAKSVDEIKKNTDGFTTLRDYFERAYGPPTRLGPYQQQQPPRPAAASNELTFEQAQENFLRSLVGYSVICYILQIKDRHNANILMDREGHIIHIDFGFVLGDTPKMAKVPIFYERAPFKLSAEFWDVLGGWNFNEGGLGVKFCKMFEIAFACASAHSDEIVSLIEAAVLNLTRNPEEARNLANGVRSRLRMRGAADSVEQQTFIMDLVNAAKVSLGTPAYDWLQKNMNGYQ